MYAIVCKTRAYSGLARYINSCVWPAVTPRFGTHYRDMLAACHLLGGVALLGPPEVSKVVAGTWLACGQCCLSSWLTPKSARGCHLRTGTVMLPYLAASLLRLRAPALSKVRSSSFGRAQSLGKREGFSVYTLFLTPSLFHHHENIMMIIS